MVTGRDFWAPQQKWLLPHNCSLSTTFETSGRQKSFPTSRKKSETHSSLKLKRLTAWKLICQSVWTWLNHHSNSIYQWSIWFRPKSMQSTKKQMNNVSNWCKTQDNKINHLDSSVHDAKAAIHSITQYSSRDCLEISGNPILPLDTLANPTQELGQLIGVTADKQDTSIADRLCRRGDREWDSMPSGHPGACENDQRTPNKATKSKQACTSSTIEQKQPQGQETSPRKAHQKSSQLWC